MYSKDVACYSMVRTTLYYILFGLMSLLVGLILTAISMGQLEQKVGGLPVLHISIAHHLKIWNPLLFFRKRSLKKIKIKRRISRKSGACKIAKALVPARAERRKPGLSSSYYWIRNVGNSRWGSNFVCLPPGIDLSLS